MDRTYLYVPPEEKAEVQALGARWDTGSKCWYIGSDQDPAKFVKWLEDDSGAEDFNITSDQAYVASARVGCSKCRVQIEVVCIYCKSGTVSGEPLIEFTVSGIWAMDDALARQLEPWPTFRKVDEAEFPEGGFANHCPCCGELQDALFLHTEPDQPFFSIPRAAPGAIKLTPLAGRIQLSGDESFEI